MKRHNRYHIHKMNDGVFIVVDSEHPIVRHPVFPNIDQARAYVAGFYGLTWEEYLKWTKPKR